MPRIRSRNVAKARAIDLKPMQQRITLAAASASFIIALLLLIRP
jgi:hypothetical protein